MAKCKNCRNYNNLAEWCDVIDDSPDRTIERVCDHYKVLTNADRIRSMNDEGLAEWIYNITQFLSNEEPTVRIYDKDKKESIIIHDDYCSLLKWLQGSVEVE